MPQSRLQLRANADSRREEPSARRGLNPQAQRILSLQRTAGNAAVQRLLEVQRQDSDSAPKPPFASGQTITLVPPPLTMSFGQLRQSGVTPDHLPSPSKAAPAGKNDDDDSLLDAENEVKAKTVETTVSAKLPSPVALILPKIGKHLLPELKPGLVFEREGDRTTKVSPQVEAVMLKGSLQALGRKFDLEGGVTAHVGSPLEIGGGFKVDLVKKEILDPLDATRTRTKTLFEVDLELQGSQQTSVDPEKGQAETKLRGTITLSF